MSSDFLVLTQNGFVSIAGLRTAQYMGEHTASSRSGSVANPPGVTDTNSGVLIEVFDGREPPQAYVQSATTTRWDNFIDTSNASTNFKIIWVRFK
jgi:hypothetical protein